MASAILHITSAGERWDLLAWRYYGDATLYSGIIMANPETPIEPVFEAGLEIVIPILTTPSGDTSLMPPWKRNAN
jgi:phage tail protein X